MRGRSFEWCDHEGTGLDKQRAVPQARWIAIPDLADPLDAVYRCATCGTVDSRTGTRTFTVPSYQTIYE